MLSIFFPLFYIFLSLAIILERIGSAAEYTHNAAFYGRFWDGLELAFSVLSPT
jgi:hypothetical protein